MNRRFLDASLLVVTASSLALFSGCHGGGGRAPAPAFGLAVSPAALSIPAGGGGFATVTVTRVGGFADPVTLSLGGAPAGVVGSGIVAATAQTGQLSLLVASGVTPQSLDALSVKGVSGSMTQTGSFRLVIAPPLPAGRISPDQVQASGGVQRGGVMENAVLASEPVQASTSKDPGGSVEVRSGFKPSASPN